IQVLQSFADQAAIAVHNAQLYARIDHERRRLAAILPHSAAGVMLLDTHLNILTFNRALERLTAVRAQDAVGSPQDDVIVWKRLENQDLRDALANGWPRRGDPNAPETLYVQGDILRQDGITQSIGITYAPLFSADGQL